MLVRSRSRNPGGQRGRRRLGNPLLYAQQCGLELWLRADMGIQYGATMRPGGTSPPALTLSGTATRLVNIHANIDSVAGGTGLGQATYRWRENENAAYTNGVLTAAGPTALGTTGLSVAMAAGPYNVDNTWDITVAQWNDQSGKGNHAAQAAATNQPGFIVAGVGGTPEVSFSAALNTQLLTLTNITAPTGFTVLAALSATDSGGRGSIITNKEWAVYAMAGGSAWSFFSGADLLATSNIKDGNLHLIDTVWRAVADVDLTTDGATVNRTTGGGPQARTATGIGGNGNPAAHILTGKVKELIVLSSAVPNAVLANLRAGIRARSHGAL